MIFKIEVISRYTIECKKSMFSEMDTYIAMCLDVSVEMDRHVVDVRVVSKKALKYYFDTVFQYFMFSPAAEHHRNYVFGQLKQMYQMVFDDFMNGPFKTLKYQERLGKDLRIHQKETLATSLNRKNNLWALDMGTGKTLAAASMSVITQSTRTVIVCPSLVKYNWFEDMTTEWGFNPLYWSIIDALKSKTIKAFRERFVVLNFEQVKKNMDYLLSDRIDHIIADEAHYLKNHLSGRSKAFQTLIKESGDTRLTMLTGTPVTNRINDMFNYFKMSNHPVGGSITKFKKRYCLVSGTRGGDKVTGAQNIEELKGLASNLMIRIRSEDCLDLPDLILKNYYFKVDEIKKEYEEELDKIRKKKEQYDNLHGNEKQKMFHNIKANIHTLNRIVATAKVPHILKLIEHLEDLGEKVIVFSGYKNPLNILGEKLGDKCIKIDGSINSHKRMKLINKFKKDPKCTAFLGNMQAAGIGINLTNARYVIFMNFPFTPDLIEQAQKRAHRSGQKKKVYVLYTIVKDTIDEHIFSMVHNKSQDINDLIDGDHKGAINYSKIQGDLFNKLLEK